MRGDKDPVEPLEPRIVLGEEGSPAMCARRNELYRHMTAGEKLGIVFCLNQIADAFERAETRMHHPGTQESEITLLLVERRFGQEIAAKLRNFDSPSG